MGAASSVGAGLRAVPQCSGLPDRGPPDGVVTIPLPASHTVLLQRCGSRQQPADHSPHQVSDVPLPPVTSHHAAGAVVVCGPARPRVSPATKPQLFRLRAREAFDHLGGTGHVYSALTPAWLAEPPR